MTDKAASLIAARSRIVHRLAQLAGQAAVEAAVASTGGTSAEAEQALRSAANQLEAAIDAAGIRPEKKQKTQTRG